MTLKEIALFKAFVASRGMDTLFISFYNRRKWKDNPRSVEEYFKAVDAKKVCLDAFSFVPGATFGADYWADFQGQWEHFLEVRGPMVPDEDVQLLRGEADKLRQNWDSNKFWKVESRLDAAMRYGIILPEDVIEEIQKCQEVQARNIEKHEEWEVAKEILFKNNVAAKEEEKKEESALDGFEIVEFDTHKKGSHILKSDEVSLNLRRNGGRLTFNQTLTKEIADRGNYEYASLGVNKNGEVALILNDKGGVAVQDVRHRSGKTTNVTISSKKLTAKLVEALNITEDYIVLKLKEISKSDEHVAYLISK